MKRKPRLRRITISATTYDPINNKWVHLSDTLRVPRSIPDAIAALGRKRVYKLIFDGLLDQHRMGMRAAYKKTVIRVP